MIASTHMPRISALRSSAGAAALLVACALLFAACLGGSGSSGFDILESAAISRVTEQQECESFDGLLICPAHTAPPSPTPTTPPDPTAAPADTPTATPTGAEDLPTAAATATSSATTPAANGTASPPVSGTTTATPEPTNTPEAPSASPTLTSTAPPSPTPSPTSVPSPGIATGAAESDIALPCAQVSQSACAVELEFTPVGFAADTAYRVASRRVGVEEPWTITDPARSAVAGAAFAYVAPIAVDLSEPASGAPGQERLQVVVLAFERDPGPVPARVARLSDTGADVAFAVAPFLIALR
jgi:hypothetical protein